MRNSKILKDLIDSKETLIMPDAYDPISARIIEYLGFKAVQCSGYSFSIAACKKDEIDIDFKDNLSITSKIVDAVSIPVMADGEDGFGGLDQISDTIKNYIEIGASGINIEDQVLDKKTTKKIIDSSLMEEKIKIAKSAAKLYENPELIINGRTDALNAFEIRQEGIKEAIKRANLYLEAGSDLVFITNVKTLDEAKLLVKEINGPLSIAAGLVYNIKNFSINDLKEIGIARVSLPTIAITAIIKSLLDSINSLKSGEFVEILDKGLLCNSEDIARLINK
ncbi:MAG: isocitrate lyase/PEP mutase family protein [Bacteroidetes bacterium]|nr:MAG: isocitrate lyase/PEP mutase family protein [Bacteroidota bacterium]